MTLPAARRLIGIDVARGLAMFGMVVTHYVWPNTGAGDDGLWALPVAAFDGRAMPLFMVLGGVGLSFLSRRPEGADRALLIRAVLLFWLGMALNLATDTIAVVLQFYGLLFLLGPLWRRLPSWALLTGATAVAGIGGWSFQMLGEPRQPLTWSALLDVGDAVQALLVNGYYPFFPVFSFFAVGVVVGRLRLGDRRVALGLAIGGAAIGFGTIGLALMTLSATGSTMGAGDDGSFSWPRLLDFTGHSEMPAWVLSSVGTSVMVLGLCLLAADALGGNHRRDAETPVWTRPVATVGMMSLSFYTFQILTSRPLPSPFFTPIEREWLHVVGLYGGFAVFALVWRRWVGTGPLEALLRIGSGRRRSDPGRRAEPGEPATGPDSTALTNRR